MTIIPSKANRIAADWLHLFELKVFSNRTRVQDSGTSPLVFADSAGTLASNRVICEAFDLAFGPG